MILVVTTNGIFVIDTSLIILMLDGKIVTQIVRKQVSTPFLSTASKHGRNSQCELIFPSFFFVLIFLLLVSAAANSAASSSFHKYNGS